MLWSRASSPHTHPTTPLHYPPPHTPPPPPCMWPVGSGLCKCQHYLQFSKMASGAPEPAPEPGSREPFNNATNRSSSPLAPIEENYARALVSIAELIEAGHCVSAAASDRVVAGRAVDDAGVQSCAVCWCIKEMSRCHCCKTASPTRSEFVDDVRVASALHRCALERLSAYLKSCLMHAHFEPKPAPKRMPLNKAMLTNCDVSMPSQGHRSSSHRSISPRRCDHAIATVHSCRCEIGLPAVSMPMRSRSPRSSSPRSDRATVGSSCSPRSRSPRSELRIGSTAAPEAAAAGSSRSPRSGSPRSRRPMRSRPMLVGRRDGASRQREAARGEEMRVGGSSVQTPIEGHRCVLLSLGIFSYYGKKLLQLNPRLKVHMVDCTPLKDPRRVPWGTSAICQQIVQSLPEFPAILSEVLIRIRSQRVVVLYCNHGHHRSVATAEIARQRIMTMKHLNIESCLTNTFVVSQRLHTTA
jgi:hypothetical protein